MEVFWKRLFAALFSALYCIFGITMIASAAVPAFAGPATRILVPADPAGGFVLCVVGAVFAFAYRELNTGSADGLAFLYIGMFLSVVFGIISLVSSGAQGIATVFFGGGETWDPVRLAVPMLYLAVGPAAGLFAWGRAFLADLAGA